jgi:hypothetical protein
MARTPRSPDKPEEKAWTPETIRSAIRKLRRRLEDVEAFDPQIVTRQFDPQVTGLETSLRETLADVFGRNSRSYRNYQLAASLDTAGVNLNGTPLHRVIEGLAHGKERSITLLKGAIRFFEEKMSDDFPGEPLDQVALSARTAIMATGTANLVTNPGISGTETQASARDTRTLNKDGMPTGAVTVPDTSRSEASFELLMARVALLEAAIFAPKPRIESPIGMGHNRGPDLLIDGAVDEVEIQGMITLLKQQSATSPVDRPKLLEIAKVIDPETNKWRERLDEIAEGVLKGASEEIGKRLVQAPWWIAVYSQLEAVAHALVAWLSTIPPI